GDLLHRRGTESPPAEDPLSGVEHPLLALPAGQAAPVGGGGGRQGAVHPIRTAVRKTFVPASCACVVYSWNSLPGPSGTSMCRRRRRSARRLRTCLPIATRYTEPARKREGVTMLPLPLPSRVNPPRSAFCRVLNSSAGRVIETRQPYASDLGSTAVNETLEGRGGWGREVAMIAVSVWLRPSCR